MKQLRTLLPILVSIIAMGGCSTTDAPSVAGAGAGRLIVTADRPVPRGLLPAHIVAIDGNRVWTEKEIHSVTAGEHVLRVVPVTDDAMAGYSRSILLAKNAAGDTLPLEIDVEAGKTYQVAARKMTYRTAVHGAHGAQYSSQWETAIVPVALPLATTD